MFRPHPKRQIPGQPITAESLNAFGKEVAWLSKLAGSANVHVDSSSSGYLLTRDIPEQIYAKITGPSNEQGGYPWAEWLRLQDGTWMASGRVGGNVKGEDGYDPTYERRHLSHTVPVTDRRFSMSRAPTSGEWLFAFRACQGALTVTIAVCGLPADGNTIQLLDLDGNVLQSCLAVAGSCTFTNVVQGKYKIRAVSPGGETGEVDFEMPPGCQPQTDTVPLECPGIPQTLFFPGFSSGGGTGFFFGINDETLTYQATPAEIVAPIIQQIGFGALGGCYSFPASAWWSARRIGSLGTPIYAFSFAGCALVNGFITLAVDGVGGEYWLWNIVSIVGIDQTGLGPPNTCEPFSLWNGTDLTPDGAPVEFYQVNPAIGTHGPNDGPMRSGFPILVGISHVAPSGAVSCIPLP